MGSYLVTGAAGFIGSEVARQLLAAGHHVIGLDNLDPYYSPRLKRWRLENLALALGDPEAFPSWPIPLAAEHRTANSRFVFHAGDVERAETCERVLASQEFDGVFHLAARAGVRLSIAEPARYFRTNVLGSVHLLEAMRRHGPHRIVIASTSSVYAGHPVPFREDLPVYEPLSPYAASKLSSEIVAATYHRLHGFDVSIARFFTVYGPAGRPDMSPIKFVDQVLRGIPLSLYGDGSQRRDFTFVEDIARGAIAAERLEGFHILNLGGNEPVILRDFIALIEFLTGMQAKLEVKPFNPEEMRDTWADITRARDLLGWSPQTPLAEGMRRTVDWVIQHASLLETSLPSTESPDPASATS